MACFLRENTFCTTRMACFLRENTFCKARQELWGGIDGILVVQKTTFASKHGCRVVQKASFPSNRLRWGQLQPQALARLVTLDRLAEINLLQNGHRRLDLPARHRRRSPAETVPTETVPDAYAPADFESSAGLMPRSAAAAATPSSPNSQPSHTGTNTGDSIWSVITARPGDTVRPHAPPPRPRPTGRIKHGGRGSSAFDRPVGSPGLKPGAKRCRPCGAQGICYLFSWGSKTHPRLSHAALRAGSCWLESL